MRDHHPVRKEGARSIFFDKKSRPPEVSGFCFAYEAEDYSAAGSFVELPLAARFLRLGRGLRRLLDGGIFGVPRVQS